MDADTQNTLVTMGESQFTLGQLAGLDMTGVAPVYGFERRPEGLYHFRVHSASLEPITVTDKQSGAEINKPTINIILTVERALELKDKTQNPDEQLGAEHQERIWISKPDDVGRLQALMKESGFAGSGTLQEVLAQFVGHQFLGVIKHAKNKNDPDNPYANLVIKKGEQPRSLPVESGGAQVSQLQPQTQAQPQPAQQPAAQGFGGFKAS